MFQLVVCRSVSVNEIGHVELVVSENVATVTLNNPAMRNAMTTSMAQELVEIAAEIERSRDIGCVVLVGAGGYFCSGADRALLRQVAKSPADDAAVALLGAVYESFIAIGSTHVPVIAAIRGGAVGAGLNLCLAADLRVVAESATLLSGFRQIGIHPGGGHFYLLASISGPETAAALGMFGLPVTGSRAVELGLAWRATPDEEVEGTAIQLARDVATDPRLASEMVRSLRRVTRQGWESAVAGERASQMWSLARSKHFTKDGEVK
jgi:enoyl-CoA hydratase